MHFRRSCGECNEGLKERSQFVGARLRVSAIVAPTTSGHTSHKSSLQLFSGRVEHCDFRADKATDQLASLPAPQASTKRLTSLAFAALTTQGSFRESLPTGAANVSSRRW